MDGPEEQTANTSLLRRVKVRDAAAWDLLTKIYGPLVYGWARRRGLQDGDAANVVQDVFLTVHVSLDPENKGRFRNWLWTIFRSRLADYCRRLQTQGTGGTTANLRIQEIPGKPSDETSEEGRRELAELRNNALLALRDGYQTHVWDAFWRTAVEGDVPADVAEDLDMSVWAVYAAKSRCLKRLRTQLEGLDVDLEDLV